jgi:hypothetical protein
MRHVVLVAALAAGACAVAREAAAQGVPAYAPGVSRYKTLVVSDITQEMMGNTQSASNTTYREATLTIAKAGAGLEVSVRLDTTHLSSSQGGGGPSANLKGLTYKATTSPGGVSTTASVTDAAGAVSKLPLAASLQAYLPRLKPGATRGQSWTDTLRVDTEENGLTITTTTGFTYTYSGDTTVAGTKLLAIGIAASGKQKGAGDTPNGKLSLEGTTTTTGTAWVTPAGQLHSVETTAVIARSLLVEDQGIAVTINQKSKLSTARLP